MKQDKITQLHTRHGLVLPLRLAPLLVALAGCGTNVVDRTISGGLIGAGGGAAVGVAVGNPAAGAVIGGVAGAVTGAVTTGSGGPNLGKPIWR